MSRKLKCDTKPTKKQKWNISTKKLNSKQIIKGARMEIVSNCEICVEGCEGVEEYTDAYIKLKLCKGSVMVLGSALDITFFEDKQITIKGKISSLEFSV